jgi:glycine betaine/proline transport system substrate-binding protein
MIDRDAFGLKGWRLIESSEQAMLGEVARAVRRNQWVVFLGWEPHPMNRKLAMDYLTGGDDFFGPNLGGATIYTTARRGLAADCPNLGRFLKNLSFTLRQENEVMGLILDDGLEGKKAAARWLTANPGVLDGWLDGVATVADGDGAAAVRAALARP